MRLTVICCTPNIDEVNELACVCGKSMADRGSFNSSIYEDADGNTYSVVSSIVSDDFQTKIASPLSLPDFDDGSLSLELASAAQAKISFELDDIVNNITARYSENIDEAYEFITEAGLTLIPIDVS